MTDKWFIQSHARVFDKAPPSETPPQWSDPRSGAKRNEIHLARVSLGCCSRSCIHENCPAATNSAIKIDSVQIEVDICKPSEPQSVSFNAALNVGSRRQMH